jgi:exosortase family protein XrtF
MFKILNQHKDKIQMLAMAVALYGLWHFGYEQYLALDKGETGLDWKINRVLGHETALWFSLFGYKAEVMAYQIYPHLVFLDKLPIISIDTPCNALPMMYLFGSFILVYPGDWKRKAVFLVFGVLFIHVLNMIRIIILSYISIYSPDYFHFNHKYLFQIIVYGVTVTLWFYWVLYGYDPKTSWIQGIREFVSFRFVKKLNQLI